MIYKDYKIRPATNKDIPFIKNVVFSVLQEYKLNPSEDGKDSDLNNIESDYFSRNGFFGVAIDMGTNEIVGTFGIYPLSHEICELRKMYLLNRARGKGLGQFILMQSILLAKEKQYEQMILETITPLKEAIALYKKNGFREIEPKEKNERVDQAYALWLK